MAYRFTDTNKWKDAWFIELDNNQKLLHDYLQDNVDNAGFLEISFRKLKFDLRFSDDEILGAIKGLSRGLIFFKEGLENGDTVYFKNFLKHQKNYPLNPFNSFHNHALKVFEGRIDLIEKSPVLSNFEVFGVHRKTKEKIDTNLLKYIKNKQGLASPIVKGIVKGEGEVIGKGKGTFEKSEKLLQMEVDADTLLEISKLKTQIQNEFTWKETVCRNMKEVKPNFIPEDFDNYIDQFFKIIEGDGEEYKTVQDTKKHFNRWLKIEIEKSNEQISSKEQGATDNFRRKTAERLGIV